MYGPEQQASPSNEPRPLRFPEVPPPPVFGPGGQPPVPPPTGTGPVPMAPPPGPVMAPPPPVPAPPPPQPYPAAPSYAATPPHAVPPPMGPPMPMPARPVSRKKTGPGLVIGIVALAVLALGGGGGAAWYFLLGGRDAVDGPPTYPQSYTPAIAAAPPAGAYAELAIDAKTEGACDLIDPLRIAGVIFHDRPEHRQQDLSGSSLYTCSIPLSNTEDNPTDGARGRFEFSVQWFEDPARARQDFETNKSTVWNDAAPLTVDGLQVSSQAYDESSPIEPATRRVAVQAVDGNVLVTVHWELTGLTGTPPDVPAQVLAVIGADYVNEGLANLRK